MGFGASNYDRTHFDSFLGVNFVCKIFLFFFYEKLWSSSLRIDKLNDELFMFSLRFKYCAVAMRKETKQNRKRKRRDRKQLVADVVFAFCFGEGSTRQELELEIMCT